jgi:hypothetical protein
LSILLPYCTLFPFWYALLVRFLYLLFTCYFRWPMPPGYLLLFLHCLLRPSFHPSMSSPSDSHSPVPMGNPIGIPMGILIFCFSSSLLCPCPCLAYCLPVSSAFVLDLMTRPRLCPFFLIPTVTAFFPCCVAVSWHCALGPSTSCPQEGQPHQYPCPRLMVGNLGLFPRRQIPMWMLMTLRLKVFFVRSLWVFWNSPWNKVGLQ